MDSQPVAVTAKERQLLRELARRVRDIADLPEMAVRRERWRLHNALRGTRPLVLCFPEGSWRELLPPESLQCKDETLRGWEYALRQKIYWWEHIRDDHFLEPWFDVGWRVTIGDYGFQVPMTYGDNRGSYVWDPPLKDFDRDFPRLHFRPLHVDRETTRRDLELAAELFGDILPVRIRAWLWWTVGLTWEASKLVGLETLMLWMCDHPERVHRLMSFLRDEHLHFIGWCEREGLLTPNNASDYVGSGGVGCTDELHPSEAATRLADRWGFAESQETVGISPRMFEEFVLPYQIPLLEKFGLNCYGCCEGLESRIDLVLKHVPRLRRVSVAPKARQEVLAERLGRNYIFSRKPNPAHLCVGFNERALREDLQTTLRLAGDGPLELIMKDTHTVERDPSRITRWVQMAYEEIDRYFLGHGKSPAREPSAAPPPACSHR